MALNINNPNNYTTAYKLSKGYRECPKCETLTFPETLDLYPKGTWTSNVESKDGYHTLTCSNCKYKFGIDLPNFRIV